MKNLLLVFAIASVLSCKKKDDPQPAKNNSGKTVYGCMNPAASNYNPQATSDACACPCTFTPNP